MANQQQNTLWWVKAYEREQRIALDDPTYELPPFYPMKEALREVARDLNSRGKLNNIIDVFPVDQAA